MNWSLLLDFLDQAEKLKCMTRHCTNSKGDPESVAEHCWRAALMAMLLAPELPEVDSGRVIQMCLIHDLGEAVTGDIPTFRKTEADEVAEEQAVDRLLRGLPEESRREFAALFAEMAALETPEARLFAVVDKLEAVIQHNECPISGWEELEYDLQRSYGQREADWFPQTARLRAEILRRTEEKIAAEAPEKAGLGV